MRTLLRRLVLPMLVLMPATGCAFHSVATHWNGRVGPNGRPVYYATVSKIGFNLLIFIPVIGRTTIDGLVDSITAEIEERGGDVVRVVQGGNENYWYAWSPFTWIITPVLSTLAVDYQPSAEELEKNRLEQEAEEKEEAEES